MALSLEYVITTPRISTGSVPFTFTGGRNLSFGEPSSARFVYAFQIRAGKVPPVTELIPPIPLNVVRASSRKKAIEVARSGV